MTRFFWKKLLRLALGAVVVMLGLQGDMRVSAAAEVGDDWKISMKRAGGGGYVFDGTLGRLNLTKRARSAHEFSLSLTYGIEVLTLASMPNKIVVGKNGKLVTIDAGRPSERALTEAQSMLRASIASRMLHDAVIRDTAAGGRKVHPDVDISHALLRTLAGDASAARGLRDRLRAFTKPGTRTIRFGSSCYETLEEQITRSEDELAACFEQFESWYAIRIWCEWRHSLMVEAAWFEFLACIGFPLE